MRLRIRHLMVLVVDAALALGLVVAALRTTGPERPLLVACAILVSPLLLACLSPLLLPPGPGRDWITVLWMTLPIALMGLMSWAESAGTAVGAFLPPRPRD